VKYRHLSGLTETDRDEVLETWPDTGWRVHTIGQDSHGNWWLLMEKPL